MPAEASALERTISEMHTELDNVISELQKDAYKELCKKDKERFEASPKPEQFPRKFKRGGLDMITGNRREYIGLIYMHHHAKVWQGIARMDNDAEAVTRYEEAEKAFELDIQKYKEDILEASQNQQEKLDLEAAQMFANRTKQAVSIENMAFQLITKDTDTDYLLLTSLARGLGRRYSQARLCDAGVRRRLIKQYFDLDSAEFSKNLNAEEAVDLKNVIKMTFSDEDAAEVDELNRKIDDYIAAEQTTLATRPAEPVDMLIMIFGKDVADAYPELAGPLNDMIGACRALETSEDSGISEEEKDYAIINYLNAVFAETGYIRSARAREGKEAVTKKSSFRKDLRETGYAKLQKYGFKDKKKNYGVVDSAVLKFMNRQGMTHE